MTNKRKSKSYIIDLTYRKRRRIVAIASLVVFAAVFVGAAWLVSRVILRQIRSPEQFRDYIESFGWSSRFVFLGLQILQVVVALIPGELVEVGAGYAFGPVEGTLLCMGGVAVASCGVFLLVKKLGVRLVEMFVSRERISELRFINSERKLKRLIFLLFFIPGTPKDLLTYFAGMTSIKLHEFLIISLIARIPSVVSSTVGGEIISSGSYGAAILLFAVTGAVSLGGMLVYSKIVKKRKENGDEQPEQ